MKILIIFCIILTIDENHREYEQHIVFAYSIVF